MTADTFDWGLFAAPTGTEQKSSIQNSEINQEEDKVVTYKYGHLLSFNRDYLAPMVVNHYNEQVSQKSQSSQIAHDHVYRAFGN